MRTLAPKRMRLSQCIGFLAEARAYRLLRRTPQRIGQLMSQARTLVRSLPSWLPQLFRKQAEVVGIHLVDIQVFPHAQAHAATQFGSAPTVVHRCRHKIIGRNKAHGVGASPGKRIVFKMRAAIADQIVVQHQAGAGNNRAVSVAHERSRQSHLPRVFDSYRVPVRDEPSDLRTLLPIGNGQEVFALLFPIGNGTSGGRAPSARVSCLPVGRPPWR